MAKKPKDMNLGRKILISLIDGPKTQREVGRRIGRTKGVAYNSLYTSFNYLRDSKGLVQKKGQDKWVLTPRGVVAATKADYELKMMNDHPDQKEVVSKAPAAVEEVAVEPEGSYEMPTEAEVINDLRRELVEKEEELERWKSAMRGVSVDWQVRHIEFLEETVRTLLSKGNGIDRQVDTERI